MNLSSLLRRRRNVYGFESRTIPDESLMTILDDARHVPSAGFTQDFEFIVVKDPMIRKELAAAGHQAAYTSDGLAKSDFISAAPVVIVPVRQQEEV